MEWTREVRMESDEERERKAKKVKKPKADVASGDEAEPKKKRRGKIKKVASEEGDEDQAMFSEEEDVEKPAKKVMLNYTSQVISPTYHFPQRPTKKRVVRDDDEEEAAGPRKKQLWVSYFFSFGPSSANNTKSPVKARKCCLIRMMKCHDILLSATFNTLLCIVALAL